MKLVSKKEEAFTIIELVISIFVLSIGVVGVFSAFSVITILTSNTSDQLIASYLTQEGIEIVRNIRDTNWLNMDAGSPIGATWIDGLDCAQGCEADYTTGTSVLGAFPMSPWVSPGRYLCTNTNGFYYYTNTCPAMSATKFIRKIIITPVTDVDSKDDHIIKVIVQVSWDEKANILHTGRSADYGLSNCGSTDNCITAEETLYDWYNYVNQ